MSKKENLVNKLLSKNIIIVALARDCEKFINSDIYALKKATYFFNNVHWLIIESDSSDKTSELLHTLSNNISNFRFITLGNLSNKMPKRTSRIHIVEINI